MTACAVACALSLVVGAFARGDAVASAASAERGTDADEYELKAAFLYNFARYTKWPEEAFESETSPIVIAVVGKDPFGKRLEKTIGAKRVRKHPIRIRRFESPKEVEGVHILVLGELSTKEREAYLEKVDGEPTLVVADKGGVEATGATIGFFLEKGRIRFEIATAKLSGTKLKLSSKLLKLARIVRERK